jgi:hypothetical protein
MEPFDFEDPQRKEVCTIRSMKALILQLREDYARLEDLWKKLERGPVSTQDIETLVEVLSWLKEGLAAISELKEKQLEGVLWGEAARIELNVRQKERQLRSVLYSFFVESDWAFDSERLSSI